MQKSPGTMAPDPSLDGLDCTSSLGRLLSTESSKDWDLATYRELYASCETVSLRSRFGTQDARCHSQAMAWCMCCIKQQDHPQCNLDLQLIPSPISVIRCGKIKTKVALHPNIPIDLPTDSSAVSASPKSDAKVSNVVWPWMLRLLLSTTARTHSESLA